VIIRIRCGWCQAEMGQERYEKSDERLPTISHGICHACALRVFGKSENLTSEFERSKED